VAAELGLRFPDPGTVVVRLDQDGGFDETPAQTFEAPLGPEAQEEPRWYLEVYPVQYTTEIDDEHAARVADRLKEWGAALFQAVFYSAKRAAWSIASSKPPSPAVC
jgi:hypothetical protein